MDFPSLIGSYYSTFSDKAEIQSCKNLYLELIESGAGRNRFALYKSPGLKRWRSAALGTICRGMLTDPTNGHLFTVQSDTIYDLLSDTTINQSYGPIANNFVPVSMDESRNSLFVVSGNIFYRVNSAALTTPSLPFTPSAVCVMGGYVIATENNTDRFYFSSNDGATWNALDYQTAEAYPNSLLNLLADHQELWLFGNRRIQVFVVGSNPNAPFVPISAGVIEMGLAAPGAAVKLDNSIFWLGRNAYGELMVWRANGYNPQRVSNHAIENVFRGYTNQNDATMQAFQLNGHSCLRLTFPSANGGLGATWNYDVSMTPELAWSEVPWWNNARSRYERHRGNAITSAFGKILVGDYANGFIYEMSPDFYTDYGYPLRWERRCPHITKDGKRIQYKRFDLFMQVGVGLTTPIWLNDYSLSKATFDANLATQVAAGNVTAAQSTALTAIYDRVPFNQDLALPASGILTPLGFYDWGTNPRVAMRYSDDGGNTYTGYRERNLGQASDYNKRVFWGGIVPLGMGRDRVWEFSGDAPIKTAIVQGSFDAVSCDS